MTTIRANYWRAFSRIFLFMLISLGLGLLQMSSASDRIDVYQFIVLLPILAVFIAFGVFCFVPREISWDENSITFCDILPTKRTYDWSQLEAFSVYSPNPFFNYVTWTIWFSTSEPLMLSFKGYQILPIGYAPADWQKFMAMLQERFPEKKSWVWCGWVPLRWGK